MIIMCPAKNNTKYLVEKSVNFYTNRLDTNVSAVGEKPQHRDKKITKPISPNISNPSQPMGLNYLWESVRTENNEPSEISSESTS